MYQLRDSHIIEYSHSYEKVVIEIYITFQLRDIKLQCDFNVASVRYRVIIMRNNVSVVRYKVTIMTVII